MARLSSEERRAQISKAMLEVMAERGYAKASMPKIAEAADVTQGLIHYHFDSKQAILLQVLETIVDDQMGALEDVLGSGAEPAEALRAVIDLFLAAGESAQPAVVAAWVTISAEAIRQVEVREAFVEAITRLRDAMARAIRAGQEAGEFRLGEQSVDACTAAILATIQGYYTVAAIDRESVPAGTAADTTWRMVCGLVDIRES
ncbi:MAG: TetR/AcrR family transcriptional regulator [Myxococcota bacterium]